MSESAQIYGIHAVSAALRAHPDNVISVCVDRKRNDVRLTQLIEMVEAANIPLERVDRARLEALAGEARHQGVVASLRVLPSFGEKDLDDLIQSLDEPALLLVLDGVTDPHNLGACLRSADAAGVHAVIAPRDRSVGLNATVRKVACGAAEQVPFIQVTNLARTLRQLQDYGVWLIGTAGEADQDLYQADFTGSVALVMGAEGKGMRRLTREHCDLLIRIPMLGSVESLNVSVATGVCLYESVRQRRK